MLPDLTSDYWNNRYLNNEFGWDIGSVSTPLKIYFDQLKNKDISILIPGAGNAYETEYLINAGFNNVYTLDFAPEPLQNIKKRIPNLNDAYLICQDFFEHKGQYDLIVEQTFFCALNPNLRSAYVKHMHELLKPGGKLIGLLFNHPMNKDNPPFGGSIEEYVELFSPFFNIKTMEPCYNSIKPRETKEAFIILEKKEL